MVVVGAGKNHMCLEGLGGAVLLNWASTEERVESGVAGERVRALGKVANAQAEPVDFRERGTKWSG